MKTADEQRVLECYEKYKDTVYRLAYSWCKNASQSEDVFQEVFYKYMVHQPVFRDEAHEKAWFIRTTINACKDTLKTKWNRDTVSLAERDGFKSYADSKTAEEAEILLEAVLSLPEKYRLPIHLYYYEDYSVREIAQMLRRKESAVQTQLQRGREKIRKILENSN